MGICVHCLTLLYPHVNSHFHSKQRLHLYLNDTHTLHTFCQVLCILLSVCGPLLLFAQGHRYNVEDFDI